MLKFYRKIGVKDLKSSTIKPTVVLDETLCRLVPTYQARWPRIVEDTRLGVSLLSGHENSLWLGNKPKTVLSEMRCSERWTRRVAWQTFRGIRAVFTYRVQEGWDRNGGTTFFRTASRFIKQYPSVCWEASNEISTDEFSFATINETYSNKKKVLKS